MPRKKETAGTIAGLLAGAVTGAKIGAAYGVVSGGWGITATVPLGILVGAIGGLTGNKIGYEADKKSGAKKRWRD